MANGLVAHPDTAEGLLANVSAVLIAGGDPEETKHLARSLESLFDDVTVVESAPMDCPPGEAALGELVRGLSAAREDRVLLVTADATRPTPLLWLALAAWPEHDVVTPRASQDAKDAQGAELSCALVRQAVTLKCVRERLDHSKAEVRACKTRGEALQSVFALLDSDVIKGADLTALCEAE